MNRRPRSLRFLTMPLMALCLIGCQGQTRNSSLPLLPVISPVANNLAVTYQVGQLRANQGILLNVAVGNMSPLPLNQQLVNAVKNNDWETAEALLTDGATPDAGDYTTGYVLPLAVRNNNLRLVKLLVERGADVDIASEDGETALTRAIEQGNEDITKYLLSQGAYPNREVGGKLPLVLAIQTGHPEIVELLLQHGANPKPEAISLLDATAEAQQQAQTRYKAITQLLKEAGAQ